MMYKECSKAKEIVSLIKIADDLQRVQLSKRNILPYKNSVWSTKCAGKQKKLSPL